MEDVDLVLTPIKNCYQRAHRVKTVADLLVRNGLVMVMRLRSSRKWRLDNILPFHVPNLVSSFPDSWKRDPHW